MGTGQGAHSERGHGAQAGARTSAKAPGQEHRWQVQAAAGRPAWLGRSPAGERQRVASEGREGQAKRALTLRDMGGTEDFEERRDMI